jgi:hypothetical protein
MIMIFVVVTSVVTELTSVFCGSLFYFGGKVTRMPVKNNRAQAL